MKECILHASLVSGNLILIGTDIVGENGLVKGNTVSISLQCNSQEELRNYYTKLSLGGIRNQSIEKNYWGALVGELTDKFGNDWLFYFKKPKSLKIE